MQVIALTQGKYAIIDDSHAVEVAALNWHFDKSVGYAVNKSASKLYLHRYVMSLIVGRKLSRTEYVDHKNRDRLDCRADNLRLCTMAENIANSKIRGDSTTRYKGVSKDSRNGHYVAYYAKHGKKHHIGSYATIEAAISARRQKEDELYGSFVYRRGLNR